MASKVIGQAAKVQAARPGYRLIYTSGPVSSPAWPIFFDVIGQAAKRQAARPGYPFIFDRDRFLPPAWRIVHSSKVIGQAAKGKRPGWGHRLIFTAGPVSSSGLADRPLSM